MVNGNHSQNLTSVTSLRALSWLALLALITFSLVSLAIRDKLCATSTHSVLSRGREHARGIRHVDTLRCVTITRTPFSWAKSVSVVPSRLSIKRLNNVYNRDEIASI